MMVQESASHDKKKVLQIFRYLQALDQSRNKVKKDIGEQPWQLWLKDLPRHPCIQLGQRRGVSEEKNGYEGDHFILRVKRPVLTEAPVPPESILPWLQKGWQDVTGKVIVLPEKEKRLPSRTKYFEDEADLSDLFDIWQHDLSTWNGNSKVSRPQPPEMLLPWLEVGWDQGLEPIKVRDSLVQDALKVFMRFEDDSERPRYLANWVVERDAWLEKERPARQVMDIFTKLYDLYARLEREAEEYELIVGDGLLEWSDPDLSIFHPVLLQRMQLEFNPSIPQFTLLETDQPSELYTALLRIVPDLAPGVLSRLQEDLTSGEYYPLDGDNTSEFLKRVVSQLSPYGTFLAEDVKKKPERGPFISRNPLIFLRKRDLGYSAALEAIIHDLPAREDLPQFMTNIVSDSETNERQKKSGGAIPTGIDPNGEDEYILLSKEANAEQLVIAQRLEQHGAVLVQGPPGTGKTHTIANLIGHLLAQGKSILVTSHTSKALQVLHEKIVGPLKPLCISRMSDDNRQQMTSSINAITERLSSSDPDGLEREAVQLKAQRLTLLKQLRETRMKLLAARQDEYRSLLIAGEEFSPSQAARFVEANRLGNDWIPGPVAVGHPLPLVQGELHELYRSSSILTLADEHESKDLSLQPAQIISPSDFNKLVEESKQLEGKLTDSFNHLWQETKNSEPEDLLHLGHRIQRVIAMIEEDSHWSLEVINAGWDGGAAQEIWESLISLVEMVVKQAVQAKKLLLEYGPTLSHEPGEEEEIEGLLVEIHQYFVAGSKLSGLKLSTTKRKWKGIIAKSRVNGLPPTKIEHFEALLCQVRLERARVKLVLRWKRQIPEGPSTHELGKVPEQLCSQYCTTIRRYLEWSKKQWEPLLLELGQWGFLWEEFMPNVPAQTGTYGRLLRLRRAVLEYLPGVLTARADMLLQDKVEKAFASLQAVLEAHDSSTMVIQELTEAVHGRNPLLYHTAFERLIELKSKEDTVVLRRRLLTQLESAAPAWANAIRQRVPKHGEGMMPGDAEKAWRWRQLNDELDVRKAVSMMELQMQIEKLSSDFRSITAVLVEKKAWAAQARSTTLVQRRALQGWKQYIQKAGKGKGKIAPHYFAKASKLMPLCQSAVPVWIMPMSRVIENFKPQTNRFDVVIIDEASQADAMALIALYMARQVVIVGDHEQVSPMDVGSNQEDIMKLILEHLKGIPNKYLYDGQFSIYALAQTIIEPTCLYEHFRCVSSIIQFSNYLSYEGKIRPLRDDSKVIIKPATVLYRVDGAASRGKTNEKEAQAVISLIMACIEQPEYDKATFGVISMVGEEQAMLIESLLQKHLPPEEYKARKMQCGNSAHFQGDERTVMFLSMVDGPSGSGPLRLRAEGAQDMFKKRFNVAASRAQDQMWVVHSLNPNVDLKEGDIRLRLIRHAEDPEALTRSLKRNEEKTESEFERLVLRRLMMADYKVTPQWEVGAFRIDLVVQGGGNRLAVECDGDKYHTLENLRDDLSRQAILERLGWTFVRIRGSQFFRDQEEAMKPVFERLEAMDIKPEGSTDGSDRTDQLSSELKERVLRRAAELRREWGFETEVLPVAEEVNAEVEAEEAEEAEVEIKKEALIQAVGISSGDLRVNQIQRTMPKIENNKATTVSENSKVTQTPYVEPQGKNKDSNKAPASRKKSIVPKEATQDELKRDKKNIKAPETKMIQMALEWMENEAEKFDVIAYLAGQGLEVADKRPKGGSLWVVGGLDLNQIMKEVSRKGYRFTFSAKGGKTTKNREGWYCNK